MRILIVEDDFTSRKLLQKFLSPYGDCDIAVDGEEAIQAYKTSWVKNEPYDLICMDIMMPNVDGQEALREIRVIEKDLGIKNPDEVKVIMTTVLDDPKNVFKALNKGGATSYIVKPISKQTLLEELRKLGLIK
ncbi:MAG TPA: response regulator [Nitrospirae bacterium]|nr:transcriptional activator protein CzcR [bacterium BMS3Abin06]HDH05024.1 response regulator [Nitrospirota bacterium]HDK16884.1 response regulator [Nitrospirota bacterium]